MKKYSEYKQTRFNKNWNMNTPSDWKEVALRRYCKITSGSTPKNQPEFWNGDIDWVTPDDLGKNSKKTISETGRKLTMEGYESCGTELIPSNSLVISTRAPIGHAALITKEMCFNQGCKALSPNEKVNSDFLYYLIIASIDKLRVLGNGTTFIELGRSALASFKGLFPIFSEQTKIANFLDQKTAQIDNLITQKEKLLKLLAKQRTAIIIQAVTKGLDPKVEMKDSGIDWLGEIPKKWKLIPLRWLIRVNSGDFIDRVITSLERSEDKTIPVIGGNGIMAWTDLVNTNSNTIAIGRVGAYCGNIHYISEESWITDNALKIRFTNTEIFDKFMFFALQAIDLNRNANQNAQPLITGEMVKSNLIAFPSMEIQIKICKWIEKRIGEIDVLNIKIKNSIIKLKEYREALITVAVTGQIDVRKEAVNE